MNTCTQQNLMPTGIQDKLRGSRSNKKHWRELLNQPSKLGTHITQIGSIVKTYNAVSKEYNDWSYWCSTAEHFDHYRILSDKQETIAEMLRIAIFGDAKTEREEEAERRVGFEILIANLLHTQQKYPVLINLADEYWCKSQYSKAGNFIVAKNGAIELLHNKGFIGIARSIEKGREVGRIWPTAKLIQYFVTIPEIKRDRTQFVFLRDHNDRQMEYVDTPKTNRIRNILDQTNEVIGRRGLKYVETDGTFDMPTDVIAVFFDGGFNGRCCFQTFDENGYISMSKYHRRCLRICDDTTVELQFIGLKTAYSCKDKYDDSYNELMCFDIEIALSVMSYFVEREIACLPTNNSFIVQSYHKKELAVVMKKAYSNFTGGLSCDIV